MRPTNRLRVRLDFELVFSEPFDGIPKLHTNPRDVLEAVARALVPEDLMPVDIAPNGRLGVSLSYARMPKTAPRRVAPKRVVRSAHDRKAAKAAGGSTS